MLVRTKKIDYYVCQTCRCRVLLKKARKNKGVEKC